MIKSFEHGILISRMGFITNLKHGPRTSLTVINQTNVIHQKVYPILAPDLLSWWEDE
jgi:hypothetical protein